MTTSDLIAQLQTIADNMHYCLHESPKRWTYEREDDYTAGFADGIEQLQEYADDPLTDLKQLIERVKRDEWLAQPPIMPSAGQLPLWDDVV